MTGEPGGPRVELYVRSLVPDGGDHSQLDLIERLQALEAAGSIAEFSVHVWGARVPQDGPTAVGALIRDRIQAFEAWSATAGKSLDPFFVERDSGTLAESETHATIVLPTRCLVESHDGEIWHVAPCVDDGTVRTVRDRVVALEEATDDDERARLRA